MPTLIHRLPKYRRHRASGQAIVSLDGRIVYLGKMNSPESRKAYNRAIAEFLASDRQAPRSPDAPGLTIVELVAAFLRHADPYRRSPHESPGGTASPPLATRPHLQPHLKIFSRPQKRRCATASNYQDEGRRTVTNQFRSPTELRREARYAA